MAGAAASERPPLPRRGAMPERARRCCGARQRVSSQSGGRAAAASRAARIGARQADASDATAAVLQQQLQSDPGMLDWVRVDASGSPWQTLATARGALAI